MAKATPIIVENFLGGWNANEPTLIDDNDLAAAENWFYNDNNLLQTRAGSQSWGGSIPDDAIVVHNMDTFNGNGTWVASDGAANVATEAANQKRGAGAVEFDTSGSANSTITNSAGMAQIDLSSASDTGTIRFWLSFPSSPAAVDGVRLRWGSDGSNYFTQTVTTQIDGSAFASGWNLLSFDWATATETGTADDTKIDYLQIQIQHNSALALTDCYADSIAWYSATNTKAVLGIESFKNSLNAVYMVAHCGDNMFNYDETTDQWDVIHVGMQETRGQFAVYKDILYYVNGTDYVSYDGTTAAQEATPEKVKYLIVKNDIAYGAGVTGSLSTLYYSNGNPASLKIAFSNSDPIEEDNGQVITGLGNIGNFVYILKDRSMYKFDASGPTYVEIDENIGTTGFRSIVNVDNNLLFQGNDNAIYNAFVEETANARTKAVSLSEQLKEFTVNLSNANLTAAIEWKKFDHVYFAIDEEGTGVPTALLVLNTRVSSLENNVGVFTKYDGINANDFTVFEDTNGAERLIVANAFGGQVLEMETGADDDGTEILVDLKTKAFEFGAPTATKFVKDVDSIFHATDGATFQWDIVGDDINTTIGGAQVSVDEQSSQPSTLGVNKLGVVVLGGAEVENLRRFKRRMPVYDDSDKIQIQLSDLLESHTLVFEKAVFNALQLGKNVFPTSSVL